MGYDFLVEYQNGRENRAADALSRRMEEEEIEEGSLMALSSPTPIWIEELRTEHAYNSELQRLREQLVKGELDLTLFTSHDGLIFYKGRLYITTDSPIRYTILKQLHESPAGGHSGYHKTFFE